MYVRIRLWWAGNDEARRTGSRSWSPEHVENLKAFAQLLSEYEVHSRLMKAEAMRELGDFADATRLLEGEILDNRMKAAKRLRVLCAARDSQVARLNGPRK